MKKHGCGVVSYDIQKLHEDAIRVGSWLAQHNPKIAQRFTEEVRRQRSILNEADEILHF